MRAGVCLWVLVCCGGILGCSQPHHVYVVEITPDGEGFQRTLTCWLEGFPKPGESSCCESASTWRNAAT
jgi:hypothetical protein